MYQHYAKKGGSQLNAIGRLRTYICFPEKKALIEAFVYLNFKYCPLVWHFTSMRSINKIESIHKRVIRLLYNDYTSTYVSFLAKTNKPSMEIKCYRTRALEIFKKLNDLNPTWTFFIYVPHSQDDQII